MVKVQFYDEMLDSLLKFAVIVSKYEGKWVLCQVKGRRTLECPGGHRDLGEDIEQTARRELFEETGAIDFELKRICVYSVKGYDGVVQNEEETFGMLYFAEIKSLGELPKEFEMERILLCENLEEVEWTYKEIQPLLVEKIDQVMVK